jgi:asparagine synthase (glutamine-hydrolysing)
MLCLLYTGPAAQLQYWRRRAELHASWLHLQLSIYQWHCNPEQWILLAHIDPGTDLIPLPPRDTTALDTGFVLRSQRGTWSLDLDHLKSRTDPSDSDCDMSIALDAVARNIYLWTGLMAVGQLYYRQDQDRFIVSNDVRLLAPQDDHLDPAGLYSLFQFGAISAPFTLFKNVKRVPPGHLLTLSRQGVAATFLSHSLTDFRQLSSVHRPPEAILEDALAKELARIPPDSGLLFSGGVDSGLLAALTRQLSRPDLRLINCDFSESVGSTDPEAVLARKMAAHLGLKFDSFSFDIESVPTMLDRIAKDYSFPFGDFSTIATNLLASHAATVLSSRSWILDGTGADGIFLVSTSSKRLNRLYQIPRIVRRFLASFFHHERLFNGSGLLSRYLGMIHQSLKLPLLQAEVISNTRLGGIAFLAKDETVREVLHEQRKYLEIIFTNLDERMQLSLLDILHICVGIYAAKDYDPLRIRGLIPFFPFLTEPVIRAGFYVMKDRPKSPEPKGLLKSILQKHIPSEMIYRPKSGFTPPIEITLSHRRVKEYLRSVVLSRDNPLRDFVSPSIIDRLMHKIWNHTTVPKTHLNFLWSYIFASIWLEQQPHFKSRPQSKE